MALFDPKRCERFETVGLDAERGGTDEDVLPERNAISRWRVDLVSELAREAQSDESHGNAVEPELEGAHVGKALVRHVYIRESYGERLAGIGSRYRDGRPLVGQ